MRIHNTGSSMSRFFDDQKSEKGFILKLRKNYNFPDQNVQYTVLKRIPPAKII